MVTEPCALLREFALIKVAVSREERAEIVQIATVFRARVIDLCPSSMVIEATGSENKIDGLVEVLAIYGIVDMARTGPVAMLRGIRCGPCSDEVAAVECEEATIQPQ